MSCMQTVGNVSSMHSQKLDIDKASPQPVILEQCQECANDCTKKQLLLPVKLSVKQAEMPCEGLHIVHTGLQVMKPT